MTTIVGMTGTQEGMTLEQIGAMARFLAQFRSFVGHHGDCVGADAQFDGIARAALGFEHMVIHPCHLTDKRAHCTVGPRDLVRPTLGPLQRNEIIVRECELLVATPKEDSMQLRSGTWTTVRYAIKAGKPVWVILRNGALVPWQKSA